MSTIKTNRIEPVGSIAGTVTVDAVTTFMGGSASISGNATVGPGNYFMARYGEGVFGLSYSSKLAWNYLQLGNNGLNWIVAGEGQTNGSLYFVVNNRKQVRQSTGSDIAHDGITAMTITKEGNVGIGTITPGASLSVAGNVSVSGTAVMASPFMYRNRIINGNMRINQRYGDTLGAMNNTVGGLSFANVANTRNYLVDRWAHQVSGWNRTQDVNLSWGGFTGAGTNTDLPTGFNKFLRVKNMGGVTTEVAGTSYYLITQPIEAENIADFGWGLGSTASAKPATLSFWVRASQTGSWQTSFQINGTKGYANYNTSYTVNSADTWEYKTVTVPAPAIDRPCDVSLYVYFSIGKNASNFDSPAGTPVAANTWVQTNDQYIGNTFKSLLDTASAYWDITGVQLEAGTVATPFEHLPMQEQIRLCQRYFEKSVPVDTRAFPPVANYRRGAFYQRKPLAAGGSDYLCIPYKVVKRGTPLLGTPVTTWNGYTRNLIVVWSPRTGAIGKFTNDTDTVDGTPTAYDESTSDSQIVMLYDAADQRAVGVHWAVDSEI